MRILTILFVLSFSVSAYADYTYEQFLGAVRYKESRGEPRQGEGAIGDNGKARGPFQIWRVYWQDAVEFDRSIGGRYEDCAKMEYSRKVVNAYMRRYAAKAMKDGNWEVCSRIHNGGPKGHSKPSTVPYWQDVKKNLESNKR